MKIKYWKNILYTVFELSIFGSAKVGLLVMSLGQRLVLDLRLGRWDLRLDLRLETYLRLAFKDLRLTCNLTLATCKHLCKKVILPTITSPESQRDADWVISPFNDFCSFWSVAINIMDKLQFLIFIFAVLLPNLCNVLLCNYRIYLSSLSMLNMRLSTI